MPTEGAIALVLASKHADHLPLFRQSQILARSGIIIHRSTLVDWMVGKDHSSGAFTSYAQALCPDVHAVHPHSREQIYRLIGMEGLWSQNLPLRSCAAEKGTAWPTPIITTCLFFSALLAKSMFLKTGFGRCHC